MALTFKQRLKLRFCNPKRRIYAVIHGRFKGEWLLVVKKNDKDCICFSLPDKHIRKMDIKDFEEGITNKVLEPVDVLPEPIYNVCLAEFKLQETDGKRTDIINRWEQHPAPDLLDSQQTTREDPDWDENGD